MDAGALHRNATPPLEQEATPAPASDVWLQTITVSFDYPVYFTADVFAPANPDLAAAIARKEPARRHRLLLVVEGNVAQAWPALLREASWTPVRIRVTALNTTRLTGRRHRGAPLAHVAKMAFGFPIPAADESDRNCTPRAPRGVSPEACRG
jgi:hypothetical protein